MSNEPIARKADAPPSFTQLEPMAWERPKPGERGRFEIVLVAEADAGQRKHATVACSIPGYSPFVLRADEGTSYYGEDSAPPPLAYLAAGAAFCLLTHLQALIHAHRLRIDSVRLEQRMRFSTTLATTMQDRSAPDGRCDGIETHVLIESSEPHAMLQRLVREAEGACMAHQTILNPVSGTLRVVHNGRELEARAAGARHGGAAVDEAGALAAPAAPAGVDADLRARRASAYAEPWRLSGALPQWPRNTELTYERLLELTLQLRRWYFDAGGMLLSEPARKALGAVQQAIAAVTEERREGLVSDADYARVRDAFSALRQALSRDLIG